MDIASMSVVMNQNKLRFDASLAVMSNTMDVMKNQGTQLTEMLQQSVPNAPHPTLGNKIDMNV